MSKLSFAAASIFLVLLIGCATRIGIQEFELYKKTFDESHAVSTAIIDQLAVAERKQRQDRFVRTNGDFSSDFVPNDSSTFSELTDPPLAHAYRRALGVINRYNKTMLSFATGKGFDQIRAEVTGFGNDTLAFVDALRKSTDTTTHFAPYLSILESLAQFALANHSREVFRGEFLRNHNVIINLLTDMRDGTTIVFPRLAYPIRKKFDESRFGGPAVNLKELKEEHRKIRVLMSDWVILMDKNINALAAVKFAMENPSASASFSGARETIVELKVMTESIRKQLAKI